MIDKGGVPVSNIKITIKDKKATAVKINGNDFDSTAGGSAMLPPT